MWGGAVELTSLALLHRLDRPEHPRRPADGSDLRLELVLEPVREEAVVQLHPRVPGSAADGAEQRGRVRVAALDRTLNHRFQPSDSSRPVAAARTAGCRRAGSRAPPAACRCGRSPGTSSSPSGRLALTVSSGPPAKPACERVGQPVDVVHLLAGQPERRDALARHGTAAAGRPCRPGSSGGCARSSRRSRPARRAAAAPSPPSRATSRSRIPCRPG